MVLTISVYIIVLYYLCHKHLIFCTQLQIPISLKKYVVWKDKNYMSRGKMNFSFLKISFMLILN